MVQLRPLYIPSDPSDREWTPSPSLSKMAFALDVAAGTGFDLRLYALPSSACSLLPNRLHEW